MTEPMFLHDGDVQVAKSCIIANEKTGSLDEVAAIQSVRLPQCSNQRVGVIDGLIALFLMLLGYSLGVPMFLIGIILAIIVVATFAIEKGEYSIFFAKPNGVEQTIICSDAEQTNRFANVVNRALAAPEFDQE